MVMIHIRQRGEKMLLKLTVEGFPYYFTVPDKEAANEKILEYADSNSSNTYAELSDRPLMIY